MEVYASEQEQVEAIKKWCKENGPAIAVGLILGLGGISGWRYWQAHVHARAEAASAAFEQVVGLVHGNNLAEAEKLARTVISDYADTTYSAFAALMLARLAVDKQDLATARQQLTWVIDNAKLEDLKRVATMRLARVHLADGKPDEAWSLLQKLGDLPDSAAIAELKGDILMAQGRLGEARDQYHEAMKRAETDKESDAGALALKLDNAGAAAGKAP